MRSDHRDAGAGLYRLPTWVTTSEIGEGSLTGLLCSQRAQVYLNSVSMKSGVAHSIFLTPPPRQPPNEFVSSLGITRPFLFLTPAFALRGAWTVYRP